MNWKFWQKPVRDFSTQHCYIAGCERSAACLIWDGKKWVYACSPHIPKPCHRKKSIGNWDRVKYMIHGDV